MKTTVGEAKKLGKKTGTRVHWRPHPHSAVDRKDPDGDPAEILED